MQFGSYQIIRKIGTGGMAQVFLAERLGLEGFHRRVALKCILPQMTRDERFVQMFINEARLGSQLHHPNIIEIQDFNKVNDVYYIAMEFVEGVDLGDLISWYRNKGKAFPPGMAIDIMLQSLEGLGYAHEASTEDGEPMNIIHRDIKPSNLLLTRRGTVKIADFGIAKAATNAYQTRTAEVTKGSLAYMSPEQITREAEPRACSDLFALGAVFFEMLSLRPLFEGDNVPSIMFKVAQVEIERDMDEVGARYPDLESVLVRSLAREQSARFQTAQEMGEALRAIRGNYPRSPALQEAVSQYFAEHPSTRSEQEELDELNEAATSLFSDIAGPRHAVQLGASSEVGGAHLSQLHPSQTAAHNLAQASGLLQPDSTLATHGAETTGGRRWLGPVVLLAMIAAVVGGYLRFAAPEPAHLSITSRPSGAQIMINGVVTSSVTPASLELPREGSAEVRLEFQGYEPHIETLTYQPGEIISRAPTLVREVTWGQLEVSSEPPGAIVKVDGKAVGAVTPFRTQQLEAGRTYALSLTLDGYETWSQEVALTDSAPAVIAAALVQVAPTPRPQVAARPPVASPHSSGDGATAARPPAPAPQQAAPVGTGELVINTIPPDCVVLIDGQRKGAPPKSLKLPAGSHEVSLVRDDGVTRKDFTVEVTTGGRVTRVWDFFENEWISE